MSIEGVPLELNIVVECVSCKRELPFTEFNPRSDWGVCISCEEYWGQE
jgi:hypothetical protein